jgi:hypothetical protein
MVQKKIDSYYTVIWVQTIPRQHAYVLNVFNIKINKNILTILSVQNKPEPIQWTRF